MLGTLTHHRPFSAHRDPISLGRLIRCATLLCVACLVSPSALYAQKAANAQQKDESDEQLAPVEAVDSLTRSMWLIQGTVEDAVTGKAIPQVTMIPGSLSRNENGKTVIRWRENLKRNMRDQLRWPRTSGYSVMRFQLVADGYQPIITQRVYRGGPHIRLRVKMLPLENSKP